VQDKRMVTMDHL